MRHLARYWHNSSVTVKFIAAFCLFLLLIAIVSTVSVLTLVEVGNRTDETINNAELQRLVLEMDNGLKKTRLLQRDFFLYYRTVGIAEARQQYALPATEQISHVIFLSQELKRHLPHMNDDDAQWPGSTVEMNLYLSAAERNADVFFEAVELVSELAAAESGVQANLDRTAEALLALVETADQPELQALYWQMDALRQRYMATQQRPYFQSAFNVGRDLRRAILSADALPASTQTEMQALLDQYTMFGEQMLELDVQVSSKRHDLDLQAQAVDPITANLLTHSTNRVKSAHHQIIRVSTTAIRTVAAAALVAVMFAFLIALMLNNAITRNITRLTATASALRAGNLAARTNIRSGDELGHLAYTLDNMAAQLQETLSKEREAHHEAEMARQQAVFQRTELAKSEKRYRALFEQSRDAIFVTTRNGEFVDLNPAALDLFGYTAEEIMTLRVQDLYVDPARRTTFQNLLEAQGSVAEFENTIRRKDGSTRVCLVTATLVRAEDGGITGYQGVLRDVTEQRAASLALERYAERLRILHLIDRAILEMEQPQASAEETLGRLRQLIPFTRASVTLFDKEHSQSVVLTSIQDSAPRVEKGTVIPSSIINLNRLMAGEVWQVDDIEQEPEQWPIFTVLAEQGIRSFVSVPLITRSALVGTLNMSMQTPYGFLPEYVDIARDVANQLAVAIQQARLLEAEQHRRQIAETLVRSAAVLSSTLETDTVLKRILIQAGEVIAYDSASLMRLENNVLTVIAHRGFPEDSSLASLHIPLSDEFPNATVCHTKEPLALADVQVDFPRFAGLADECSEWSTQIRSWLGLPMILRDQVIGMITLDRKTISPFSEDEIALAMAFANQAATALENARLYNQTQARATELESLLATARDLSGTLDLPSLLKLIAERTTTLLRSNECMLFRLEDDQATLKPILVLGQHSEQVMQMSLKVGQGLTGYAVENRQPVLANFAHDDPRAIVVTTNNAPQRAHALVAPMVVRDQVIGAMVLNRDASSPPYTVNDLGLMVGLARHAAVAIENASLYERIRHHAAELEQHVAERTAELQRANTELRALTRLKDEFVSNVSHELRTPITSLKLRQHLLQQQPERLGTHLPVIQREIERLSSIVEDLLDLSRMQQGQMEFRPSTVDLNQLAREYVHDRAPVAQARNLSLIFEPCGVAALMIQADPGLLGQALSILVTNALNYTLPGGLVTVSALTAARDQLPVAGLRVADTGMGIAPDEQDRLFEPFVRGRAAMEAGAPGTGLGLALLKQIVDRHSGWVEVQSTGIPGQGSVFTLWLPVSGPTS